MIEHIRQRRDALAAQMTEAQSQYSQLEATIRELDRQICAMAGGLKELDDLCAQLALLDGDRIPEEI